MNENKTEKKVDEANYIVLDKTGKFFSNTLTITDSNGTKVNLEKIRESVKNIIKDENQREKLDKVRELSTAILGKFGDDFSFMLGWIIKGFLTNLEKSKGITLSININKVEIPESEIKEKVVNSIRQLADDIEKIDVNDIKNVPETVTGLNRW